MKKRNVINTIIIIALAFLLIIGITLIVNAMSLGESMARSLLIPENTNVISVNSEQLDMTINNCTYQNMVLGAVLSLISGMGLVVCLHWYFVYLKSDK